jgi:hypothetical protein
MMKTGAKYCFQMSRVFASMGQTDVENGSLTAHRYEYITEVLEDHVMPFMITLGEHGILMHDNARPHAARIVRGYLDEVGIRRFDWPGAERVAIARVE